MIPALLRKFDAGREWGTVMKRNISVVGGDLRQLTVYEDFLKDKHTVNIFGFDKSDRGFKEQELDKISESQIVILPMPVSTDRQNINAVFSSKPIKISDILEFLSPAQLVFGGGFDMNFKSELKKRGIAYFDYLAREELAIKNAVPTVEGAISIAINETPITIDKSRCLVLGYGRIGKILADRLRSLGADVTVCARKYKDLAYANSFSYKATNFSNLKNILPYQDIVFNTVPSLILDYDALKVLGDDTLIIDLASRPGGVDFDAAKRLGTKVIWALSLPGKTAPVTSGKIIKDTIVNILNELEV